jgi:cobalt/nickel transport system permease protein
VKHSFIDKYGNLDSFIHRLDARIKLIALFSFILIAVSEPRGILCPFIWYGIIIAFLVLISRVPVRFILGRCLVVSPFILMAAVFYPLSSMIAGDFRGYEAYNDQYAVALSIALKAFSAIILLTLLVSTEKFHNLLLGLRQMKMPRLVGIISALMYRYIFILSDEALKTNMARESRTPGKLKMNKFRVYGNQSAMIFLRSLDRSRIIYNSMLSRGFTGEFPAMRDTCITAKDTAFLFFFILILLAIRLTNPGILCLNNLIRL